jgi:hypothetical protein
VVNVEGIEEEESHVGVVHRTAQSVQEDGQPDTERRPGGLSPFAAASQHLSVIAHINNALRKEDCIVTNHQKEMVNLLLFCLHLPEVQADGSKGSNKFDEYGEDVACPDKELEHIKDCKDTCQRQHRWHQVNFTVVVLGDHTIASPSTRPTKDACVLCRLDQVHGNIAGHLCALPGQLI